ncbi:hypothetical protein DICPUDRAFT_95543 [Dictyostelium purpureum]|uniref:DNA polymerase kappa n=1 Tax=Dictyostelium purpureum TaxID=5786 RepID=F0ZXP0_DICPU|nr:uncharacterized protein DICPUDRAFT_95543 [Dictyostelium purpureum]EGC31275.1 hypothetical protein DICPUDRAFT_95543 [Dictyostelium purpureum]|eukprot:XP_003292184.1 hypothetical protein DICPUDRAFT_95543 [Dictyostelium purpureum]
MNTTEFKAGMEKVDIELINSMLKEFSVGTHFQQKLDRDFKKIQEYIGSILSKLDELPDTEEYQKTVDEYIEKLKTLTDQSRMFIHIDMDAFYANVEEMDNPELNGHPVAVGSIDMLVTSNYEARKYGVRSGLPGLLAMKLCPQLVILPSRMDRYREVSSVIRNIFSKYDPNYVSPSLDEGCIDITDYLKNNEGLTPVDVANSLQSDIYNETTLTSSMGISCSPLLSKICSEINKPNGFFFLENKHTQEFIKTIQIKKLPGIGKVRQELLKTLGLVTVGDVIEHRYELYFIFPEQHRDLLFKHALAVPIFPNKSSFRANKKKTMISKEKNCKELYDENDLQELMVSLHSQCIEMLSIENKLACSIIVKVQDFSFKVTNYTYSIISTKKLDNQSQNSSDPNESFGNDEYSTEEKESMIKEEGDYFLENNSLPTTASPNKKKRQIIYPKTFVEHTEKIWDIFNQTVSPIKFESIRCLGLKLCNLIEKPEECK